LVVGGLSTARSVITGPDPTDRAAAAATQLFLPAGGPDGRSSLLIDRRTGASTPALAHGLPTGTYTSPRCSRPAISALVSPTSDQTENLPFAIGQSLQAGIGQGTGGDETVQQPPGHGRRDSTPYERG
jgi:hypothetical protein